jgi:hypothetical protein
MMQTAHDSSKRNPARTEPTRGTRRGWQSVRCRADEKAETAKVTGVAPPKTALPRGPGPEGVAPPKTALLPRRKLSARRGQPTGRGLRPGEQRAGAGRSAQHPPRLPSNSAPAVAGPPLRLAASFRASPSTTTTALSLSLRIGALRNSPFLALALLTAPRPRGRGRRRGGRSGRGWGARTGPFLSALGPRRGPRRGRSNGSGHGRAGRAKLGL